MNVLESRVLPHLALVVAAAVLVASCSGGGDDAAAADRTTTTTAVDTTTTEAPSFTGDADSPFCELLRGVDPNTLLSGDPADPSAVEAGFRRLVGVLRDLHDLAPPEVEADAAVVANGIEALDEALAAVDYDFDALAASGAAAEVTDAVNDPAFTTAGNRLSAYRTQVCHL